MKVVNLPSIESPKIRFSIGTYYFIVAVPI